MIKNQLKSLCASVIILLSASLSAENISVVYDSADLKTTYGDGVVSIGYDGDNSITSLSAKPGDTANNIDFTGDGATFSASSSTILLESLGSLVFKNQLLANGQSDQELAVMDLNSSLQVWTGSASMENPTATPTLLAKGVALAAITNITASLAGTASGVDGKAAVLCFPDLSNDGKDLTCQFQLKSSSATLRSILLRFTQEADDIYVNVVGYGHISYSELEYKEGDILIDKNIQSLFDDKVATWATGLRSDCYIANLAIFYDTDKVAKYIQPRIVFAASNVLENVDLNIGKQGGVCLEIDHSNAFPVSGKVKVLKNSRLVVNSGTPGNNTVLNGIDNAVPITVEKDGVLEVKVPYAFDADQSQFILNGGEFLCNIEQNNPKKDSSVYIHNITFRDGAKVTGNKFRIRANETVWKAEGSSPSFCDCGIIVWTLHANTASNFKYSKFIIDVDDIVSGVDFYLNGTVELPSTETYTYCTFIKRGLGTMRIGNEFKMTNMPTRIEGGTFFIDGNRLDSQNACSFTLAGGILAVAADSTNSCGELQVESSSTLQIPDGASVSFASSKDSQAWTGILTVDANLDACSVRFGSDENGLSASQRIKIRTVDGRRVKLDETGRLYPADGFMLFVR